MSLSMKIYMLFCFRNLLRLISLSWMRKEVSGCTSMTWIIPKFGPSNSGLAEYIPCICLINLISHRTCIIIHIYFHWQVLAQQPRSDVPLWECQWAKIPGFLPIINLFLIECYAIDLLFHRQYARGVHREVLLGAWRLLNGIQRRHQWVLRECYQILLHQLIIIGRTDSRPLAINQLFRTIMFQLVRARKKAAYVPNGAMGNNANANASYPNMEKYFRYGDNNNNQHDFRDGPTPEYAHLIMTPCCESLDLDFYEFLGWWYILHLCMVSNLICMYVCDQT